MNSLKESVSAVNHVNKMIQKTAENAAVQAENMRQLRMESKKYPTESGITPRPPKKRQPPPKNWLLRLKS